jgi:hypothetical protein
MQENPPAAAAAAKPADIFKASRRLKAGIVLVPGSVHRVGLASSYNCDALERNTNRRN